MKDKKWLSLGIVMAMGLALIVSTGRANQEGREQDKRAKIELPAEVVKVIKANFPNAEIDVAEVEKETGITLYDIEFKAEKGEIEVAEDGTIMDIATIVAMKDVPEAALEAIQKAAGGATVKRLEKSEIRAQIAKEGDKGKIVKFDNPKYVYEAELKKGNQTGEIQVAPDGKIVESLKWSKGGAGEQGEGKEAEEVKEGTVDLKVLPEAVLLAFRTAYSIYKSSIPLK